MKTFLLSDAWTRATISPRPNGAYRVRLSRDGWTLDTFTTHDNADEWAQSHGADNFAAWLQSRLI